MSVTVLQVLGIAGKKAQGVPYLYILNAVRCPYVRNGRHGQLGSNDVTIIMTS